MGHILSDICAHFSTSAIFLAQFSFLANLPSVNSFIEINQSRNKSHMFNLAIELDAPSLFGLLTNFASFKWKHHLCDLWTTEQRLVHCIVVPDSTFPMHLSFRNIGKKPTALPFCGSQIGIFQRSHLTVGNPKQSQQVGGWDGFCSSWGRFLEFPVARKTFSIFISKKE